MLRAAALAGVLVAFAGCASASWRTVDAAATLGALALPPQLPAHRAVERVTLRLRGHEFEFVGYRTCDPATDDVRTQLLLESGISVLDVSVHGDVGRRNSGSAFEAIPHLADLAMSDLRRTWGARSVFHRLRGGEAAIRFAYAVTDGRDTYPAARAADGSWIALGPRGREPADPVHVTLLGADLVPEATIAYADFDDDGVPREIRLVDLRDAHTLDVEVEEVHVHPAATPEP